MNRCAAPRRSAGVGPLLAAALVATSCTATLAPAFDNRFADSTPAQLATLGMRLQTESSAAGDAPAAIACATSAGPEPALIAYDLEHKRVLWRNAVRAESRPELLGDLVLTTAKGRLLGFDATSGRARLNVATGDCSYRGAARSGERLFFTCALPPERPSDPIRGRVSAIDLRASRLLWQRDADGELGRPAALGRFVFVPWQWQNLALLDAQSGRELARVRSRDDVIEWVRADTRGVFFGQRRLYRFGRLGYGGAREAAGYAEIDTRVLPGRPASLPSAFLAQPATRGAYGRIALYLEPEALGNDGVAIAHDRYYFTFYRYVFAFDAGGQLRWARMLERDSIAGTVSALGLTLVSDAGRVRVLSQRDGADLYTAELGSEITSATLSAAGLTTPPSAAGDGGNLRRELTEIALDTDTRLVPARAYAIAQLARLDEPDVTRDLLDIYAASSTPPELQRVAADALRARKQGLEHLVDALAAHYDFIEQSRPAPLQVIVPPLLEAHDTRAVPHLVERMLDPETPLAVLPLVVRGVAELGDDSVLDALLGFVRFYRADSSFAEHPEALLEAMQGVALHAHERGPALLAALNADGRASPALTAAIRAESASTSPAGATATASAAPPTEPPVALAAGLSQAAVREVFAEHIDELRGCLIDELARNPKLAQLRIAFIAESDGSTHALHFAPNTSALVDCLYPKVAAYRFPRFASGRTLASYVVAVRAGESEPVRPLEDPSREPFWQWYARRPRAESAGAELAPWWRSQQQSFAPLAASETARTPSAQAANDHAPSTTAAAAEPTQPSASAPAPATTPAGPASAPASANAGTTANTTTTANTNAQADEAADGWWVPKPKSAKPTAPK